MKNTFKKISFLLGAACAIVPAFAQTSSVASVAMYDGADRQQRLITEAKKEGSLTLYTSMAAPNIDALRQDFEKKYGVKVVVWRAGDVKVVQRVLSESKAGRAAFDLIHVNTLEMEALHKEGILQQVYSPNQGKLMPVALPRHKEYAATRLSPIVVSYNTNQVSKADLPKTYQDLLDPKWKGKLGIEATDQEWFYLVIKEMGQEKGLKYFRDLMSTNKPSVRTGHSLLNNMVVSGDVPMALTVYGHMPLLAKQKGAPIDWFALKPTAAVGFAAGLAKKAPNPHAAILFYDFMLTDAQKTLSEMGYIPTNKDVDSAFKNLEISLVDHSVFLEEFSKWDAHWDSIVIKSK